jgi:hypothetical protein
MPVHLHFRLHLAASIKMGYRNLLGLRRVHSTARASASVDTSQGIPMKFAKPFARHAHFPRLLLIAAMAGACWAPCAHAMRPFEGTDAAVAEPGIFELEFSPIGYVRNGPERLLIGPYVVGNVGFSGDTELVLEGRVQRQQGGIPDGYRSSLGDTMISVKHVFRHGSLQEGGSGVSLAAECGVLLPEYHGETGTGATCDGIASQRFALATVHVNAAFTRTRAHTTSRFLGLIVDGGGEGALHPVMEVFAEREDGGSRTRSALLGLVWKKSEELAFDVGVRKARTDGESLTEVRMGLTWSYAMHK